MHARIRYSSLCTSPTDPVLAGWFIRSLTGAQVLIHVC